MEPTHIIPEESKEYYTSERCHILELLNTPKLSDQSIARARVKPGVTTAWHALSETSEIYYILEGTGKVEIGNELNKVTKKGELVYIPPNTRQRIKNIGETDLIFLCICVPRFQQKNYQSEEE